MNLDLYRLVYYSRNLIPGRPVEIFAEVEQILSASHRNNARADITGALIFNAGVFAQVLEGARMHVEATFERIQRDRRHAEVQVLAFEPVENRGFPSWSMAFVGRSLEDQNVFGHISEKTGFEAKHLEGNRVFDIMRSIALEEEARAA